MAVLPSEPILSVKETDELAPAAFESYRWRPRAGSLGVWIPGLVVLALLFACFLWPLIYKIPSPVRGSILESNLPIGSPGHILGTDTVGDDIMSRILYGGRVSFEVAAAVQAIGLVLGGLVGIFAGFVGGVREAFVMRILDVLIAFPAIVLVLAIVDGLGASELHVIWGLCVFSVPAFARVSRAATLRLREQTFVLAAGLSGSKRTRIIFKHVVPNVLPQLITFALLGSGVVIILEATLSFFGYGIPLPGPSWGNMIAQGAALMSVYPRLVLVPSAFLFVTVVALNSLGDGLRARWGVER